MRIRWTWRKALIAAVVVVAAVFVVWTRGQHPSSFVHDVKLGQTPQEVLAIMGEPTYRLPSCFLYGQASSHVDQLAEVFGRSAKIQSGIPRQVHIYFDVDDGRVDGIKCVSAGIDLHR